MNDREPVEVIPVVHTTGRSSRPVGAYVVTGEGVRFRPAVDPDRLALYGAAAVVAIAVAYARARPPAIGSVSMGPGGWVSLKGAGLPRPRAARPWWARLLRARRLVVER